MIIVVEISGFFHSDVSLENWRTRILFLFHLLHLFPLDAFFFSFDRAEHYYLI